MSKSLPLEPLETLARVRHEDGSGPSRPFSDTVLAEMVGVSSRAVARWRANDNRLPWATADTTAVALGLHPVAVWGDDWVALDAGILDGTDRAAIREMDRAMETIGKVMRSRKTIAA